MNDPSERYWEILTYMKLQEVIDKYKKKAAKLEKENKELKEELKKVRQ